MLSDLFFILCKVNLEFFFRLNHSQRRRRAKRSRVTWFATVFNLYRHSSCICVFTFYFDIKKNEWKKYGKTEWIKLCAQMKKLFRFDINVTIDMTFFSFLRLRKLRKDKQKIKRQKWRWSEEEKSTTHNTYMTGKDLRSISILTFILCMDLSVSLFYGFLYAIRYSKYSLLFQSVQIWCRRDR